MRTRRFPAADKVFSLPGGNEDNDLWVQRCVDDNPASPSRGAAILSSLWVPDDEERIRLGQSANVELLVWGGSMPPVCLSVSDVQPGRTPDPLHRPEPRPPALTREEMLALLNPAPLAQRYGPQATAREKLSAALGPVSDG